MHFEFIYIFVRHLESIKAKNKLFVVLYLASFTASHINPTACDKSRKSLVDGQKLRLKKPD